MADSPLHPIADRAALLLARAGGPPFELEEPAAESLRAELVALFGKRELEDAVADLIRLACHLDTERGSPTAARGLLALAEECAGALEALDLAAPIDASLGVSGDRAGESLAEGRRFLGGARARAPKVGEDAPEGSVKLGSLDYPKRG